jgi:hypothetical protein
LTDSPTTVHQPPAMGVLRTNNAGVFHCKNVLNVPI